MLDLNEQPIPSYQLKVGVETKSYDPLILGYALKELEGVQDPSVIREKVREVFGIDVDAFSATAVLNDFFEFAKEEMEEPLKKVFGRGLFSTTTSESTPEKSKT